MPEGSETRRSRSSPGMRWEVSLCLGFVLQSLLEPASFGCFRASTKIVEGDFRGSVESGPRTYTGVRDTSAPIGQFGQLSQGRLRYDHVNGRPLALSRPRRVTYPLGYETSQLSKDAFALGVLVLLK